MEEEYKELTFKELWYGYIVPFLKWFGRSIKKTFTSKRLIAVVLCVLVVPLAAWGVLTYKNSQSELTLYKSTSSYILLLDSTKITVPVTETGAATQNPELFAMSLAESILSRYNAAIVGDAVLAELYANANVRTESACLTKGLTEDYDALYLGKKTSGDTIDKDYFVWAMSRYISASVGTKGAFTVTMVSNLARNYSDNLIYRAATEKDFVRSSYYETQLAANQAWPVLTTKLMDAINAILPETIIRVLPNVIDTETTVIENSALVGVDCLKSVSVVRAPATNKVSNPDAAVYERFALTDWIKHIVIGFAVGVAIFLLVDLVYAVIAGEKRYRGVAALPAKEEPAPAVASAAAPEKDKTEE